MSDDALEYWVQKTRSGGAYVPPSRCAVAPVLAQDASETYQRAAWDALKKSLTGIVNRTNTSNIKTIIVEAFRENLVRGRGLLVRALLRAQSSAVIFTPTYAALVAVLNSKIPQIGELLLHRLIHQFKRLYKRRERWTLLSEKGQCVAIVTFVGQLVNQRVAHEIVVLQLLMLLLEHPEETGGQGVEIAVGLMRQTGPFLSLHFPRPTAAVFERFRDILREAGGLDKRVQYMIEVLFQLRKEGTWLAVPPELDLVDEEDQITHHVTLEDDDDLRIDEHLNVFQFDPDYERNEEEYERLKCEILGGDNDGDGAQDTAADEDSSDAKAKGTVLGQELIRDETGFNLVNLRKIIYLTLMSSIDVDECGHKLLKISIPEGHEIELCNMIVECCSQERTYLKYYGLLAERFCRLNPLWEECFGRCFGVVYGSVHKIDTVRIRNICKLFGHLLETDALSWAVFACVRLTEDDTTAASRIFLKFLFQELAEFYSEASLKTRLYNNSIADAVDGLFVRDSLRNIRFTIAFFEAIELPALAERQTKFLADLEAELDAEQQQYSGHAAVTT